MYLIKMYNKAIKSGEFFNGVKEYLLNKNLIGAFDYDVADEILDAFLEFLDSNYPSGEMFYYTDEDKLQRVNEFCDEIFSWLSDDYGELEMA